MCSKSVSPNCPKDLDISGSSGWRESPICRLGDGDRDNIGRTTMRRADNHSDSLRIFAERSPVRICFYQFREQEAGKSLCTLLVQMATAVYRCIAIIGRNNDLYPKRP